MINLMNNWTIIIIATLILIGLVIFAFIGCRNSIRNDNKKKYKENLLNSMEDER